MAATEDPYAGNPSSLRAHLEAGVAAIDREVARRGLSDTVSPHLAGDFIRLDFHKEGRHAWIGYLPVGYFLVFDRAEMPVSFFDLTPETIESLMPATFVSDRDPYIKHELVQDATTDSDASQRRAIEADDLLSAIEGDEPDVQQVEHIIDRSSITEEGLDVLSTVAAIRARRRAISKLVHLMKSEVSTERTFQNLFAAEPWMLGTQYRVAGSEQMVWFRARVDLLLIGALGYVDVIELKRPSMTLFTRASRDGLWKESAELSDAYSQARDYLRLIDENRDTIEAALGLRSAAVSRLYRSSIIIVAGRYPTTIQARDMIRDLNASSSRIILLTYDEVVSVAESTVSLFERRLDRYVPTLGA